MCVCMYMCVCVCVCCICVYVCVRAQCPRETKKGKDRKDTTKVRREKDQERHVEELTRNGGKDEKR